MEKIRDQLINQINEKKEKYIAEALKELIDRNILVIEENNKFTVENTDDEYNYKVVTGCRLVVKDMEYIRQLEKQIQELKAENERIRKINNKFKLWGTDGCSICEEGRITLYAANKICITCRPEEYR